MLGEYDFRVIGRQVVVGASYFGQDEVNEYFSKHKLKKADYSDRDINNLVEAVCFVLDPNECTMDEDYQIVKDMLY